MPGRYVSGAKPAAWAEIDRSAPRLTVSRRLDDGSDAVHAARAYLRELLPNWTGGDVATTNAALDTAHELVTNAVQHGSPPLILTLEATPMSLFVAVRDGSRARAVKKPYRAGVSDSGLGLHLVSGLSQQWGQEVDEDGKTVWAHISRRRTGDRGLWRDL